MNEHAARPDSMDELVQHSRYAGQLFLQPVPGDISARQEAENNAEAGTGRDRSMYAYAPRSGCPHPKQCPVVMVLGADASEESARRTMARLGLDKLAEEQHVPVLFPTPTEGGWNYQLDPRRENDLDYLVRCFGVLKGSAFGISGFNGMVFYIADCPEASALLMTLAAKDPLHLPAMLIGAFPQDYAIPADALGIETAACVCGNAPAADYLRRANQAALLEERDDVATWQGQNPNCLLLVTQRAMDAPLVSLVWERLFRKTRRWQNDTYGCYQKRTDFVRRGFVPHVKDPSLGCNNGFPHTWYEYIPPQLRGTREKAPLLFYFHGGGCVPLYGAEQSGWHDIADQEGFIVVYPEASQGNRWNPWDDRTIQECSDLDFFLALIQHMKEVHPIDEGRIYVSGFSMGGMMSNALACAFPEIIAAAAPCNAFHEGYFSSLESLSKKMIRNGYDPSLPDEASSPSPLRQMADAKKAAYDYRMPVIQTVGLADGPWPIRSAEDARLKTFQYWKRYNHLDDTLFAPDPSLDSGLHAEESIDEGADRRFLHQRWFDPQGVSLYDLFAARRCPHALDIRTAGYLWQFLRRFAREADGALTVRP